MTDELEQGGIRHNATDACPSGRPYPHTYDRRCDGDPFDRTPHGVFHGKTHTATQDFGLPTVGALRQQVDQLTRERDYLAAQLATRPSDLDHAAVTAERDDLRHRLDLMASDCVKLVHDRQRAHAALVELTGEARATDRTLRRLRTAARELVDALDEGDIAFSRIERVREILAYQTEHDTRMTLTDKGREILATHPATDGTGSVLGVAREVSSDPDATGEVKAQPDIVTDLKPYAHNPDYGVPKTGEADITSYSPRIGFKVRYMMATRAHQSIREGHKVSLRDLSRDTPHLAVIYGEHDDNWIGEWVEGLGFINVRFPKHTTRPLTAEEAATYHGRIVTVGTQEQGYVIRTTPDGEP